MKYLYDGAERYSMVEGRDKSLGPTGYPSKRILRLPNKLGFGWFLLRGQLLVREGMFIFFPNHVINETFGIFLRLNWHLSIFVRWILNLMMIGAIRFEIELMRISTGSCKNREIRYVKSTHQFLVESRK